ncbi:MAG: OB-fold domain-containing protein [Peptococcaceae bacterium]|nr:OB-fold domain-containing protein [Peptococcaceae bacterium]
MNYLTCMKCEKCGKINMLPVVHCRNCGHGQLKEITFSEGSLYSYTKIHVPPDGWNYPTPYIVGVIELEKGSLVSALYCGDKDDLAIGNKVNLILKDERLLFW